MEKDEVLYIGDKYISKPSGEQYRIEPIVSKETGEVIGQTETAFANHTPILKEQRTIDNGIEVTEELVFNVRRAGRSWGDVSITTKDILSNTPNLKFGAACRIYLGRNFKSFYSESMQMQCENAPHSVVYQHTGYSVIDGERVFLNGGYSVTAEGLTDKYNVVFSGQLQNYHFTNEKHDSRYNTLLRALPKVAPKELVFAGLGLSFLTPLNAMLREKGVEQSFILYFVGKTGARKTTLAKLFLNFFGTFDNGTAPPAGFRDTINAIEKKFALLDSTLTLLDDRIPSTTPKIRAQVEAIEQASFRLIGDRSGRARMNADGTLKATYIPKCGLITTAEEAFSNAGESGVARSLAVELKPGDVDLTALTEVQQRAEELNECMSEYIQYVIVHWDELAEELKPLFIDLRSKAQNGGHGRLAECVAHLEIGITVLCRWLESIGEITTEQAEELKARAWDVFVSLAEEQNRRITNEKPVKLFIDAIKEMKDRGEIRFDEIGGNANSLHPIGYTDKYFYYCYPDSIYSEVKRFYAAQDINFPLGKSALFQQLAIDGLIEADKGQSTKVKRIGEKRPRFLWLRVEALDNDKREEV